MSEAPKDLGRAILAAAGGKPLAADLYPFDQLHPMGAEATRGLAADAGVRVGDSILDVGAGLGGPARLLASEFGARVTGIEIDFSYVEAARLLTARTGLDDRVRFVLGDALALPFAGAFDVAWVQQSAMNVADKVRLYGGIARALKAGGRLVLADCLKGPGGAPRFPVPWAGSPERSFLVDEPALGAHLAQAGFRALLWRDATAAGIDWFRRQLERPARPGADLVMGPDFPLMVANLLANLEEGRVALLEAVLERPA